jgi:hypothetical protein
MDQIIFCDSCAFSANEKNCCGYRVYTTQGGAEFALGSDTGFCSGCESLAAVETFRVPDYIATRSRLNSQECKSALEKLKGELSTLGEELDTPPKGLWQRISFAILNVPARRYAARSRKQKELELLGEQHQWRLKERYAYERLYRDLRKRNPRCLRCGSEQVILLDKSSGRIPNEGQILTQTHPGCGCGGRFVRRGSFQHSDIDDSKQIYDTEAHLISEERLEPWAWA